MQPLVGRRPLLLGGIRAASTRHAAATFRPALGAAGGPAPWAGEHRRARELTTAAEGTAKASDELMQPVPWSPETKRCGALGVKVGMMSLFDGYGVRQGVTVIWLDDVVVTKIKSSAGRDEVDAVQVGIGHRKMHKLGKAQRGQFYAAGVDAKKRVAEFPVSPEALHGLEVGQAITARHFVPGQYVDVQSRSKGKGTTGVMKRWGFKGGPASHGATKFHRKGGSSGALGPTRVLKGKKMSGRMGNENVTVFSLQVYKIDVVRQLLYLKGAVPGPGGGIVRVVDGRKGDRAEQIDALYDLPMPTWIPELNGPVWDGEDDGKELIAPLGPEDPLAMTDIDA